jgi:putative 4-mercaptohistidine N1-methyltranferase
MSGSATHAKPATSKHSCERGLAASKHSCKDEIAIIHSMNPYETDNLLREYLLFHFGDEEQTFGRLPGPRDAVRFAQRCVTELWDAGSLPREARALDVGCAVGGSCFELAKRCPDVVGIDYSRGFIAAARALAIEGVLQSMIHIEAGRHEEFTARVEPSVERSRVQFEVGDAMALRDTLEALDVVLAANLICRLPEPSRFLDRLPALVKPGGQLLLTTPFTWLEDYTPRANWLGHTAPALDELAAILAPFFRLEFQTDLPFVIREHARKFQYGIALGTRWRRLGG